MIGGGAGGLCHALGKLFDLKSVQIRNYWKQQASYAKSFMGRGFLDETTFHLLFCDLKQIVTRKFTYQETLDIVNVVVDSVNNGGEPHLCDYLQLARSHSKQAANSREREVSEISAGLKALAKELNIPVLVLAQLNRDVEKRAGNAQGKPVVSDLRDSGSIEQDADQIIMIHRPYMYNPDKHDPTEAQWIIGKNRFGRLGRIQFRWTAELTKYEEEPNHPANNK